MLSKQAAQLAAAGYTSIWFPPPSDAVSPQGYLPRDLYDLNSAYGSEAELRDCIAVFKENGIKVIADIVINHRCAWGLEEARRRGIACACALSALPSRSPALQPRPALRCAHYQSADGKWNKFGGRLAWDTSTICKNNRTYGGTGNHKTGAAWRGLDVACALCHAVVHSSR